MASSNVCAVFVIVVLVVVVMAVVVLRVVVSADSARGCAGSW